jgi:hypothetical protein
MHQNDLDDCLLLQALLHLPSLEVWRSGCVCEDWRRVLKNEEYILKLWSEAGGGHPMGMLAQEAVWLHTVMVLPKVLEVWKQTQKCVLVGVTWLVSSSVETLLEILRKNDRPWNPQWGACEGTMFVKSWSFKSFEAWDHPAVGLEDFLQMADLSSINRKFLGQVRSEPLQLVACGVKFSVSLLLFFNGFEEAMLGWTIDCAMDLEDDLELELSGCLVSPCFAKIRPFGVLGQSVSEVTLSDADYWTVLQSLYCKENLVCILRGVSRYGGVECNVSTFMKSEP